MLHPLEKEDTKLILPQNNVFKVISGERMRVRFKHKKCRLNLSKFKFRNLK